MQREQKGFLIILIRRLQLQVQIQLANLQQEMGMKFITILEIRLI
jgi:hypothetical protein